MAAAWGSSFLFMKVASAGLSPGQIVLGRLALGAAALVSVQLASRGRLPRNARLWAHGTVLACLGCVLPFLLFAAAAERIPSGLSSVYNAATPLVTAAVTLLVLRQEAIRLRQLITLVTGAGGVMMVLAPWQFWTGTGTDVWGQLACLGATLCLGTAFAYTRKFVSPLQEEPTAIAAVQMLIAAIITLLLGPFIASDDVVLDIPVILCMLVLGVLSTGFAYIWSFGLIARAGAVTAASTTYVTPLVGVALGALILQERLGWNQLAGGTVVIVSLILSAWPTPRRID